VTGVSVARRQVALVTGATAGIGAAFARRLARESYELILVARDADRLARNAQELIDAHGVTVETIVADLVDEAARATVEERLADRARPVDLLVNNAGMGLGKTFQEVAPDHLDYLLRLNVLSVVRLAKAAVGGMVERRSGAILNVSSVAGFFPYGTYSATKAFVTSFSQSLAIELDGTGVRVMALCPGFVRTEFHARAGIVRDEAPGWSWLKADDVVDAALRGWRGGQVVIIPDVRYKAVVAVGRRLPLGALSAVLRRSRRRR
jgi:short-subunit dehydrogenase